VPDRLDTGVAEPSAPDRRVARDTVIRYLSMSIVMVVSFLLLPFLLRHIGKPAYGLQALAHQSLEFVAMLAFSIGISYDRIAASHYSQGEYERMNAVLSAGLTLSILVGVTIFAAACLIAAFAHVLFDLPSDLVQPAQWVVVIFGIGAALQIISHVYRSSVYMTQRLYLDSIANMMSILVPAAIVIPLFTYWRASIVIWVGLSVAARLLSLWTIVIPLGRRGVPQFEIRLFAPRARREMRELVHFGGLTVIGSLGALLYYTTDAIMVSNLNELGIQQVVNYNVAQRWYPQISMFASSFVLILGPAMIAKFAADQFDTLREMVTRATRYCFTILAFPCVLLFIQAEDFLRLWLGSAFVMESVPVMRVIMCALVMSGAGIVSREALYASRKIRGAVLATLLGGVLNIVLSVTLVKVGGMGLLGIATGSLISLFLLEVLCLPYFLCRHLSLGYGALLRGALRALLGAVPLVAACLLLRHVWTPTSLLQIVAQFALCGLAYLPSIWFVSLTKKDRQDLQATLADAKVAWQQRRDGTTDDRPQ
jgi:O-antigen/teichoic acid export membrane protein